MSTTFLDTYIKSAGYIKMFSCDFFNFFPYVLGSFRATTSAGLGLWPFLEPPLFIYMHSSTAQTCHNSVNLLETYYSHCSMNWKKIALKITHNTMQALLPTEPLPPLAGADSACRTGRMCDSQHSAVQ